MLLASELTTILVLASILLPQNGKCEENSKSSLPYKNLFNFITKGRNPRVRPGALGEPTEVYFVFEIFHVDIDEHTMSMYVNAQIHMRWTDESLKWNPDDYGGINITYVPQHLLWIPPMIVPETSIRATLGGAEGLPITSVLSNGTLDWFGAAHIKTYCDIDLTFWPFDRQSCFLSFTSYYDRTEIQIDPSSKNEIYRYTETAAGWLITEFGTQVSRFAPFAEREYDNIMFNIGVQRLTRPLISTVVIPTIIITQLTLAVLWISSTNTKKLYLYAITIVLTIILKIHFHSVLVLSHMGNHPPIILLLTSWSLILTVISLLFLSSTHQVILNKIPIPNLVQNWILHRWVVIIFLLGNSEKPAGHHEIHNPLNGNDVEIQATIQDNHKKEWFLLSDLINRILLVVFSMKLIFWLHEFQS